MPEGGARQSGKDIDFQAGLAVGMSLSHGRLLARRGTSDDDDVGHGVATMGVQRRDFLLGLRRWRFFTFQIQPLSVLVDVRKASTERCLLEDRRSCG